MKTPPSSRRKFIRQSAGITLGGCLLASCPKAFSAFYSTDEIPDPKKLNYCGYSCPDDCKLFIAAEKNDEALKKEAYEMWRIEDKYGLAFDPEQVVCFTCKTDKSYKGVVVENCTVRKCAIEKGYDCCIECNDLKDCKKEIWETFPDFHKSVIEMQSRYLAT